MLLYPAFILVCGQGNLVLKDITVLDGPADNMMNEYLTKIVDRQFAVRDSILSGLHTEQEWDWRAGMIRDSMLSWTGPFPERNPLNARITGRLERDGYVVEKILFESRPDFLVSANLYLPDNAVYPCPAILNVIGHSPTGKARDKVQKRSIAQARKGFVVLTLDCLGQGERLPPAYRHLGPAPGHTHNILGRQAFICGTHLFNLMVWDAVRAVDYLISRPEVDPENICVTGCSGGGMMSTYLLPFEPRIKVAVPACNPNTWSHRVHAGLATDSEQVFFGAFSAGIDPRGDPLFVHVPGPLMINATSEDNLNPPFGVWELSTWLYKSYAAHGAHEKFTTTMVRAPHGYNLEQRELAYSWMLRWTGGDAADFWEGEIAIDKEEDLWATAGGNVFLEPASREPQELILDYLEEHRAVWEGITEKADLEIHRKRLERSIKKVLHADLDHSAVKGSIGESYMMENLVVRPFIVEPEEGILLPGVLLEPRMADEFRGTILYISEDGKSEILEEMGIVTGLLGKGYRVCAADLRGTGETLPDMAGKFWDFLAGRPIFGQRVMDVLALSHWLKGAEAGASQIKIWGKGMGALYGSFAGVMDRNISGFVFEEPLISFESLVRVKVPEYGNEILLPGILQVFDMPQVYQSLAPRPVNLINAVSGDKSIAEMTRMNNLYEPVTETYRVSGRQKDWNVQVLSGKRRERMIVRMLNR